MAMSKFAAGLPKPKPKTIYKQGPPKPAGGIGMNMAPKGPKNFGAASPFAAKRPAAPKFRKF